MIVLGVPEHRYGNDLSDNRRVRIKFLLHLRLYLFNHRDLSFRVYKNGRTVLATLVPALLVETGGIMHAVEKVDDICKWQLFGIK